MLPSCGQDVQSFDDQYLPLSVTTGMKMTSGGEINVSEQSLLSVHASDFNVNHADRMEMWKRY